MSLTSYQHLIADTYHAASLANATMLAATPILESLREILAPRPQLEDSSDVDRGFAGGELLARQLALTTDQGLIKALTKSRQDLLAFLLATQLGRIRAASQDQVWSTWTRAFGTAMGYFEMNHCQALAEEVRELASSAGPPPDHVVKLADATPLLVASEWADTHDVFALAGSREEIPVLHRCKALISAAQVEIFFGKRLRLAEEHLDEARRLTNDGRVAAARADLRKAQGRPQDVLAACEEAIQLSPERADGYLAIARLLLDDPDGADLDAVEQWARKSLHCIGGLDGYDILIELAFKRKPDGLTTTVADYASRIVRGDPDRRTRVWTMCVRLFTGINDYEEAHKYSTGLLSQHLTAPERYQSLLWHAVVLDSRRDADGARQAWLEALALEPTKTEARSELESLSVRLVKSSMNVDAGRDVLRAIRKIIGDSYAERERERERVLEDAHALTLNDKGNRAYEASDFVQAIASYEQAVALKQDAVMFDNLANAWRMATHVPRAVALDHAIDAAARAFALEPTNDGRRELRDELLRERSLEARFDLPNSQVPNATPIAVELAPPLGALMATGEPPALTTVVTELLATMRATIASSFGVSCPGVKIREVREGVIDRFMVVLKDVPVLGGRISHDQLWIHAANAELEAHGIECVEEVPHPRTNVPTSIVSATERDTVSRTGFTVHEPVQYVFAVLHSVLERNLHELLTMDEVHAKLGQSGLAPELGSRPGALVQFTFALRALLEERAPVMALSALWKAFVPLFDRGAPTVSIVEQLRRVPELERVLPGQTASARYLVADELADLLKQSLYRADSVPVLAMEPDACQAALTAIRTAIDPSSVCALVCEPELRPFVRKLVELKFPDLSVLSKEELLTPADDAKTIRLEGGR